MGWGQFLLSHSCATHVRPLPTNTVLYFVFGQTFFPISTSPKIWQLHPHLPPTHSKTAKNDRNSLSLVCRMFCLILFDLGFKFYHLFVLATNKIWMLEKLDCLLRLIILLRLTNNNFLVHLFPLTHTYSYYQLCRRGLMGG